MAYDNPRATTDAEIMALNAELEPRKISPKMTTRATVKYRALRGSPSFGCTLAKTRLAGSPRSLAKAQVMRLLVVMMLTVAKTWHPSGKINRHTAPALDPVALYKICKSGPAVEDITPSMSPATKSKMTRKMNPVETPIPTQATIILGPTIAAPGISSIRCATASYPISPNPP